MNAVLEYLENIYGSNYQTYLIHWLNVELNRTGKINRETVLVKDAGQDVIIASLKELMAKYPLTIDDLLSHVYLLPCISKHNGDYSVYCEISAEYFKDVINKSDSVEIIRFQQVHAGDVFEKYGSFKPPLYEHHDPDGEVISAFVEGIFSSKTSKAPTGTVHFAIWLNPDEIEQVCNSLLTDKLQGMDVTCHHVLEQQIYSALLYRLYTESCFSRAKMMLDIDTVSLLERARQDNIEAHENMALTESNIYNRHHKKIGTKVQYYQSSSNLDNNEQIDKAKNSYKQSIQVINGEADSKIASLDIDPLDSDQVATEFGYF